MSVDAELDAWRREWQSERRELPDLSVRVRRHSRFMKAMLASETAVTVVIGGGAVGWAVRTAETDVIVLAGAVWLFLAAAWIFAFKSRKGCWAPAAQSASAYLDISIRRCRGSMAASIFGTVLYFCEIFFCLIWIYRRTSSSTGLSPYAFLTSPIIIGVWACTVVFVVAMIWYRRRKRVELDYLLELEREQARPS
jgi:hypothetical protein